MIKVKVCGITNLEDALYSIEYGADALGFVFAKSPRQVTPQVVKKITRCLPPLIHKVGVFVNEPPSYIQKVVLECELTVVQLHGEEIPEFCHLLPFTVIKAIRVKDEKDIKILSAYHGVSAFLLDSYEEGKKGGTGKKFDWKLVNLAEKYNKPIILAGGLNTSNVISAVKLVKPYAVDVSSGVESKPGRKDKKKLKEFITKVKKLNLC